MLTLKTIRPTTFKRIPVNSTDLPEGLRHDVAPVQEYVISAYMLERGHIKFTLAQSTFKGFNTWYAFGEHVQVLQDGKMIVPKPKAEFVKLDVPYKSQLDNQETPYGTCNVTSLAMCLEFLGAKRKHADRQFEDELFAYAEFCGLDRHSPQDLATIVKAYGCKDDFRTDATIEQVKDWLTGGNPVVVHGYFTTSGHIVVIVGYDDVGFLVHDPYGEWTQSGYRTDLSGKYVSYSYGMIRALCIPDGSFWVHFISK